MTQNFPSAPMTTHWESRIFVIHSEVKFSVLSVTVRPGKHICDPVCENPHDFSLFVIYCFLHKVILHLSIYLYVCLSVLHPSIYLYASVSAAKPIMPVSNGCTCLEYLSSNTLSLAYRIAWSQAHCLLISMICSLYA